MRGCPTVRSSKARKPILLVTGLLVGATATTVVPATAATAATAAPSRQLKLSAMDDTYVSKAHRATFGNHDRLLLSAQARDTKTAFLKFAVPAGVAVKGARLTLTAASSAAGKLTVRRVADYNWTENTLTPATTPALGAPIATATTTTATKQVAFELGKAIAGPGIYAFAVQSSAKKETRLRSAESGTGRPVLTLTTTPAPKAALPAGTCVTNAKLVPSCGVLWGAAAGGFTEERRDVEHRKWEKLSGRTATIFHAYHKGDQKFPTEAEIAMTRDPANPRVLLLNWRVEYGSTWAKVAAGKHDDRIDRFAARVKATYPEKFFLVLNHEPEDDVIARAGSGMTAKDFAASYRHVVKRLRAKGVTNVINVVAYMGNENWMAKSWWKDLYPGDDVVDWMGLDSYISAEKNYYHYGKFADLLDRAPTGGGTGWYDWATTRHPGKPIMIVEWGVYHREHKIVDKSAQFNSVLPELAKRPAIKAISYFDAKNDASGNRDISMNSSAKSLAAFRKLAANPLFNVTIG